MSQKTDRPATSSHRCRRSAQATRNAVSQGDLAWLCTPFNAGCNGRKDFASIGSIGQIGRRLHATPNARPENSNRKCCECGIG